MGKDDKANSDDASDLFRKQMEDVTPMHHDKIEPSSELPKVKQTVNRHNVDTSYAERSNSAAYVVQDYVNAVGVEESLSYSQSGISAKDMKQLKRGDFEVSARLDIHGKSIDQASTIVKHFIASHSQEQQRFLLLVHGKGHRSADGAPTLKSYVNQWLRTDKNVLAFCSCQARDGGTGAVYIRLKKPKFTE